MAGGLSPRSAGVAPAPPLRVPGALNARSATSRPAPAQSRAVDAQTGHAQRADDGPHRRRAADYRGVPRTMGAWVSGRAADYNAAGATAQGGPGGGGGARLDGVSYFRILKPTPRGPRTRRIVRRRSTFARGPASRPASRMQPRGPPMRRIGRRCGTLPRGPASRPASRLQPRGPRTRRIVRRRNTLARSPARPRGRPRSCSREGFGCAELRGVFAL